MKKSKKGDVFLTDTRRDLLSSCLVIISAFIIPLNFVGISAKAYVTLFIVDGIYTIGLWGFILLLSNKSRSEVLKRIMTLFGVAGAAVSIFLMWAISIFQI